MFFLVKGTNAALLVHHILLLAANARISHQLWVITDILMNMVERHSRSNEIHKDENV